MSNLRRYYATGNYYFVTTVTFNRAPILVTNIDLCQNALAHMRARFDPDIVAWVILPDHMHLIANPKVHNLSDMIKSFKQYFGFLYRQRIGTKTGRVWQYRFWDHIIRHQDDMNRHIEYIHYNPVKHGLARSAGEYAFSSFADYVRDGYYQEDWRAKDEFDPGDDFGE
jgi:putative transposase